ncbi:MAG TPA: thymidine phosphorylase [Gaiellaceae bacterium]|jgi:pyrimidine-nucleoside phosphorylase|nr:thymidine phosphorylase [Gaiellaceae bacterium]
MNAVEVIERKRNGDEIPAAELREFVAAYARDEVPDYQAAALLMAVWFRGLSHAETFALTEAMVASGDTVDLAEHLGRRVVDKHSTGGVGDKTTIAVGPVVAACGAPFGKMSGRGLGHTGGTLDKLESIAGFRVELSTEELVDQVREIGLAVAGQSADLVPADRKLYALRDVTATIDEVSLIAASIMSKKIAGGASALVLDVKVGEGAFMRTQEDARRLAEAMRGLGEQAGMDMVCLLTDMEQPLGSSVGNALEVQEAYETLAGGGPSDFRELVVVTATHLLELSDLGLDEDEARQRATTSLADGSALVAYERWIRAQGGDPDPALLPRAPVVRQVAASSTGFVRELRAREVAAVAMSLGAGRERKEDQVDHAVGVVCRAKRGDRAERGEPLAEVHARDEATAEMAVAALLSAYEIGEEPEPRPLVLEVIH